MKRWLWLVALVGCDDGGGGDDAPAADTGVAGDSAVGGDAAPPTLDESLQAFCAAAGQARCAWAFECVGEGPQLYSALGLRGPTVDDCATDWADACLVDARARATRGTLDFSPDAVDTCVRGLTRAPCPGRDDVRAWVADWHKFVDQQCRGVIRGTVGSGDDCTTRNDCQVPGEICDGVCRLAEPRDVQGQCEATGAGLGALNEAPRCAGEVCVAVGDNAEGVTGLCTVDCMRGTGCPNGAYCLQLSVNDEPPNFFCTIPCQDDGDCLGDLSCVKVDPMGPDDQKHCFVTPE